jgi:HEAT repeat protein
VVDLLGELLGDSDEDVQAKAAMALAEVKNDKAKAYLTLQYGRRGRSTRQAIVRALKAANVPGAMAGVVAAEANTIWERNLQALTQGTLAERVGAAEEVGKSGRAEAVNRLLPLIKDSQVLLAAAAVRGLGNAGDRRAAGPIAQVLSENIPDLREAASESLMKLQEPSALPKLAEVAVERSTASPSATAAILSFPRSPDTDKALCAIAFEGGDDEAQAAGREMRRRGGCPLEARLEKLKQPSTAPAVLRALVALGPTAKDAAPKLLPLLTASDAESRRLAAEALAELGDPSALPAIQKAFEQELKALEGLRSDWIPQALPKQFADGFDPATAPPVPHIGEAIAKQEELLRKVDQVRESKAKEANKLAVHARVPSEVVDDAPDGQMRMLGALLKALGSLKAEGAVATLKPYTEDSNPDVRAGAFVGLARSGPEGVELARPALLDADRQLQAAVAQALAESGEGGQAAIIEVLGKISGDRVRLLEALARAGVGPKAANALAALVGEGGPEASLAANLLGELKAKSAVDALLKSLDDPSSVARKEVLTALGKIGDPKAADAIARDLYHDSPDVRSAAADAIATLGGSGPTEALDALKGDYYRKVRDSAEAALKRVTPAAPEAHR